LLAADLGVRTTREILQAVRDKVERRPSPMARNSRPN